MERTAGILMPIFSLPSPYGIGCFSQEAYDFVDWLAEAGQTWWQILPLGPTSYGDSPYQSFSTYAGNPYFISPDALAAEGVLTHEECLEAQPDSSVDKVNYGELYTKRYALLRKAYQRSNITRDPEFLRFQSENAWWLNDYSLFMALKDRFGGKPWTAWPEDIRLRWDYSMDYYRTELYFDIEFHQYMQYKFLTQWMQLKKYANEKGIQIIGDIPIYVSMDSADVWARSELFQLNEDNTPSAVAGCPPDGFSADGQLWGNPLYRWDYHKEMGFSWWIGRLWYVFRLYDVVRIDHFRGFDEYFSIPYGDKNAKNGHWEKGPGMDLFNAVKAALGDRPVIAEDLGFMTETVRQLVKDSGFPGMKVLEFAFDARDTGSAGDYLPHNYPRNSVCYTGTHDNQTMASWFQTITQAERNMAREYLCDFATPDEKLLDSFVAVAMRSNAGMCIIPMQDYMGLDDTCRINTPSTLGTNWMWRLRKEDMNPVLQKKILDVTTRYGRRNRHE